MDTQLMKEVVKKVNEGVREIKVNGGDLDETTIELKKIYRGSKIEKRVDGFYLIINDTTILANRLR